MKAFSFHRHHRMPGMGSDNQIKTYVRCKMRDAGRIGADQISGGDGECPSRFGVLVQL